MPSSRRTINNDAVFPSINPRRRSLDLTEDSGRRHFYSTTHKNT
nr:MAG TPA: hypothetical protein [Caudoviricetes sp.]